MRCISCRSRSRRNRSIPGTITASCRRCRAIRRSVSSRIRPARSSRNEIWNPAAPKLLPRSLSAAVAERRLSWARTERNPRGERPRLQQRTSMKLRLLMPISAALLAALSSLGAHADAGKVVIGDIDDMSGLYADILGPKGVEAIKMAVADFGGSALGQPIELMTFDHQNKPALGAEKFREWADRDGLTMLLGGNNTGVSLAMAPVAKEKKIPFFAIGAAGASLTGKDCTPYTIHYAYDTTALGNGTATTILDQGDKTWFFLTADYAFGTQLQESAARVVTANGGKVVGAVRVPLNTSDFSSYLLQAQSSGAQVLGLANAGNDFSNALKAANELGVTKTMKPAALLAFITDIR